MKKKILVPVADGTEEMEAVILIDILRRAGYDVLVAGTKSPLECSRGVIIKPDILLDEIPQQASFDVIVLPGGMPGTENLKRNKRLKEILAKHHSLNNFIAAICAAPLILAEMGFLDSNNKFTAHPSLRSKLRQYHYSEDVIVEAGNILTGQGAGVAIEFALMITKRLSGKEKAEEIAKAIIWES